MADINLHEIASLFAHRTIVIHSVYKTILQAGNIYQGHLAKPTTKSGFLFVVRGRANFIIEGALYELTPGKIVHGGANMRLEIHVGHAEFEYYLIHYSPSSDESGETGVMNAHFELNPGTNSKVTELFHLLYVVSNTPGHLSALKKKALFYTLLEEVLAAVRSKQNKESHAFIEDAIEYIHNHYMDELTVQGIASRYGISSKYFSHLFHKYNGVSPMNYLIQYRMNRAEELLTLNDATVRSVARSVGYSDSYFFSRLFKKHKGISPSRIKPERSTDK